ncbi:MAG: hypothetical protein AAFU67_11265, partial [Bacteroidota bacterium]
KYRDTLLYAEGLRADFNLNPLILFSRGLEIEELEIRDTRFRIRRDVGDTESNLEYALDRLFPPKDDPQPLNLNLKRLDVENITFIQADSVRGQHLEFLLLEGKVRLRDLDLPGKRIDVKSVELYQPVFKQVNFTPNPLDEGAMEPEAIEYIDSIARNNRDSIPLHITVENIELVDGQFGLDNLRKAPIETADISAIDFARLDVRDINLEIVDLAARMDTFTGQIKHLSLTESSGFALENLSVTDLTVGPKNLVANDIELLTPNSSLGDTLSFRYSRGWTDWESFTDRVRMKLDFTESEIAVRDIMYFARNLRFNQFFRENQGRKIRLDGQFSGPINELRARNLELSLDEKNYLAGNFSSSGLTAPGGPFLILELDYAVTNMNSLRRLINGFNPPPAFDRLGTLRFSGDYTGFLNVFAATGDLQTDIGRATLDMNMDLSKGVRNAVYDGALELQNFDLGNFLNNDEFGLVSFNGSIEDGRGLVAETASGNLTATIDDFTFRDYTYRQATISGQLNRNFFNGDFALQDENIDFNFRGELDFRDSIKNYDFSANVARLDLQAVNLSQADLTLSGQVDLQLSNSDINDVVGRLLVRDLQLIKDKTDTYNIDSLLAYSSFIDQSRKVLQLESDIARGKVEGDFQINQIVSSLKQFLLDHYPGFAQRLKVKPPRVPPGRNRFEYDLTILDSKGLNYLLSPELGIIKDFHCFGRYNNESERLLLDL